MSIPLGQQGLLLVLATLCMYCASDEPSKSWQKTSEIQLGEFNPLGIAVLDSLLWISDSDHNQIGLWTKDGTQVDVFTDFDRPMHIASDGTSIFVPEYGSDTIRIWNRSGHQGNLPISDSLDAPAGVDVTDTGKAIADFYNHRILYSDGSSWQSFGTEGNAPGEFYYPTDVHLGDDKIYVADAYNNRVQILSLDGSVISVFGREHDINAATGIYVSDTNVFVTDFENDRVLVFDKDGILIQAIDDIEKPTDAVLVDELLYVASYAGKKLMVFNLR